MKFLSTLKFGIFSAFLLFTLTRCSDSDPEPVDCTATGPTVTINSMIDATCNQDNGEVNVTVAGGDGLEFSIAGSAFQAISAGTISVTDLPSGSLVITVRDANSCTTTGNFTIDDINNVAADLAGQDAGCLTSNGSITVTPSGGVTPYSFSLDGGALQTDDTFSGLAAGDYTVLTQDSDGCETSSTITVLSGVSYTNQVKAIVDTNCAIGGCHDGNTAGLPDWSVLANIQTNADNIKSRTAAMTMPPASSGITLDQAEIDAIGCWVDDGALDN